MDVPTRAEPDAVTALQRAEQLRQHILADPTDPDHTAAATAAAAQAVRAGDHEALIVILRAQAFIARSLDDSSAAKQLMDRAARTARRHGLDRQLFQVLLFRSGALQELGRIAAAQRDLNAAAGLLLPAEWSDFALQQAALFHNTGRFGAAAELYRRVLTDPVAAARVRAMTANNLSLIEVMLGDLRAAVEHVQLATELARDGGAPIQAGIATNRSWIAMRAGRLAESLQQFDQAAAFHEAAGLPLASHYLSYVDALIELRLLPEAQQVADRAIAELQRNHVPLVLAEGHVRRARIALLLGRPSGAMESAALAAQLFSQQGRPEGRAQAIVVQVEALVDGGRPTVADLRAVQRAASTFRRLRLTAGAVEADLVAGRAALCLERPVAARMHLRRARELADRNTPVLVRLKGNIAGALESVLAGDDRGALRHCRAGLDDLDRHRNTFASLELRVLASGHGAELGRVGVAALLRNGTPAEVFRWFERTRAAALVAAQPTRTAEIDDGLAELRIVQQQLASVADGRRDGLEDGDLLARQAAIEQRIRRATWVRRSEQRPDISWESPAQLRFRLDGRALVEYGTLDGELIAVVLETRATRVVHLGPLAPVQQHVDLMLFALRRLARPGRSAAGVQAAKAAADAALLALRRLLLDPLLLPPDLPVVIIPTVTLQRVPWTALRSAAVEIAPSATFWARTHRPPDVKGPVVLVAGPTLPGATAEVQGLGRMHDRPITLLPPASTVAAVTAALSGAGLAHLACHGLLRSDNPSFSALQLSDGSLTVHELDVKGIAPHRMVLAACDSAADAIYEGNEMLGFVSALMARGTRGLVASIVVVPDVSAGSLMQGLHRRILRGDRLAEALFAARADIDPTDPAQYVAWCGFNTYGAA